jgi:hypothetical protein
MPSHTDIIKAHGATKLATQLAELGHEDMKPGRVQQWANRDSIPPEFWQDLDRLGVTTLADLAAAKALPLNGEGEEVSMPDLSHTEGQRATTIEAANSGGSGIETQVAE